MTNEFRLQGKVLFFDEHPMRRYLMVETFGAYQPIKDEIPIFVKGACRFYPDKDILKAGENIHVVGQIVSITASSRSRTIVPRLIADEISRDNGEGEEA
jgi:hypothetical protein